MATTDLFTVSVVLPFPEWHIVGIIQYSPFSDWLRYINVHLNFLCGLIGHFFLTLIFHRLDVPHAIYVSTYWKQSWLPPNFGNYRLRCHKHPPVGFCVGLSFQLLWVKVPRGMITGSYAKSLLSFVRNCQTILQNEWIMFHSHQQRVRVTLVPHPH